MPLPLSTTRTAPPVLWLPRLFASDLATEYRLSGGHLFHGEHAIDQLVLRPSADCARYRTPFEGLYLCGSGSHPGGGLTCVPGALAARVIG